MSFFIFVLLVGVIAVLYGAPLMVLASVMLISLAGLFTAGVVAFWIKDEAYERSVAIRFFRSGIAEFFTIITLVVITVWWALYVNCVFWEMNQAWRILLICAALLSGTTILMALRAYKSTHRLLAWILGILVIIGFGGFIVINLSMWTYT